MVPARWCFADRRQAEAELEEDSDDEDDDLRPAPSSASPGTPTGFSPLRPRTPGLKELKARLCQKNRTLFSTLTARAIVCIGQLAEVLIQCAHNITDDARRAVHQRLGSSTTFKELPTVQYNVETLRTSYGLTVSLASGANAHAWTNPHGTPKRHLPAFRKAECLRVLDLHESGGIQLLPIPDWTPLVL